MNESAELKCVRAQLDVVRLQNEIAHLDREWERECNRYMLNLGGGWRVLLNRTMSVLIFGFGFGGFGIFVALQPSISEAPSVAALMGTAWTIFCIGLAIYFCALAGRFKEAEDAYQTRRAHLVRQQLEKGRHAL